MQLKEKLISSLRVKTVFAHCDVPCGIYDTKPAQIAAETILKMTQKIIEQDEKKDTSSNNFNSMTRFILTKEEHGRILKHELTVLWADFFKPEHLQTFPDLHDTFWKTLKLVSTCKQHVDLEAAQQLKAAVDKIADMFTTAKAATK